MVFKGIIAATASVALMATPAMAASSASSAAARASVQAETVKGMQLEGGNMIVIILALVAAGLGLWVLLDDNNDKPVSP
ncbi:MAG: hypothetical protein JWN69_1069 [Alphaproteobacteria bacterium]|nr:hypothetical protein [Alphaproteobacteria bacterium]